MNFKYASPPPARVEPPPARPLSRRFGVSHATVVNSIARLQKAGFVSSQPYRSIFLTEIGRILFKVTSGIAPLENFQHEEDDFGISLSFSTGKTDTAVTARLLVDRTPAEMKASGTLEVFNKCFNFGDG